MKEAVYTKDELKNICAKFAVKGELESIEPIKTGHINDTMCVTFKRDDGTRKSYTLQSINTYVFKKPEVVMNNIMAVTDYLCDQYHAEGLHASRHVLKFYKTVDGQNFYRDEKDRCWRVYLFVGDASTYNNVSDPVLLYNAGKAFGEFQKRLSNFPMDKLEETIPNFHNTPDRYRQLKEAIENNVSGRADLVKDEIDFFMSRENEAATLFNLQKSGDLPLRVTHNDTKYNNVLIDDQTHEAICVIDLDTIMPGLSVHDFGDAIRFATATAAEDEKDLSKVHMNIDSFDAFTKGFIGTAKGFFTQTELDNMVMGAKLMTLECAVRFLTDYINGDVYFKTDYPEHNLDRAHTQIKLVSEMEQKEDEMQEIVRKYSK